MLFKVFKFFLTHRFDQLPSLELHYVVLCLRFVLHLTTILGNAASNVLQMCGVLNLVQLVLQLLLASFHHVLLDEISLAVILI